MSYERLKCQKCDKDFGQEAKFIDHLADIHGINDSTQLYLNMTCNGIWPTCQCSEACQERLKFVSWKKGFISKYARGHNARVSSVYLNPNKQKEFAAKRSKGYADGKYSVWNRGLTKETSTKIAEVSAKISASLLEGHASGKITDWHKTDPQKSLKASEKMSKKKKELFASGVLNPWNKGKTKYDDPRIAAMAFGIKENYAENPDASSKRLSPEEFFERVAAFNKFKLISDHLTYKNKYQKLEFECVTCGARQRKNLMMLENSPVCFSCTPRESKAQIEIYNFVKNIKNDALLSDRSVISPKELDIWIPSVRLGIEYNGLYWHSESVMHDHMYHQIKYEMCRDRGVSLLSIYEDEWRDKRHIVEGMIRHRLLSPLVILDARKLDIVELNPSEAYDFFESNHLEGHARAVVTFGLRDSLSGMVIAGMSLRRPFHRKYNGSLEVGRCCTLPGHSVRGWLGKLTAASKEYARKIAITSLMTYVDSRVGSGSGYIAAGWQRVNDDSSPRFWWTDFVHRHNRFKYRADKSRNMSQQDVATEAGVVAIYGSSNSRYEISLV